MQTAKVETLQVQERGVANKRAKQSNKDCAFGFFVSLRTGASRQSLSTRNATGADRSPEPGARLLRTGGRKTCEIWHTRCVAASYTIMKPDSLSVAAAPKKQAARGARQLHHHLVGVVSSQHHEELAHRATCSAAWHHRSAVLMGDQPRGFLQWWRSELFKPHTEQPGATKRRANYCQHPRGHTAVTTPHGLHHAMGCVAGC